MPIYAYRCENCGHAKDVLRKISDPVLTVCPACGQAAFRKQVTAAGFQLKGSGWYVTDFRGDKKAAGKAADGEAKGDGAPAAADGSAASGPAGAAKPEGAGPSDGAAKADGASKSSGKTEGAAAAPAAAPPPPAGGKPA